MVYEPALNAAHRTTASSGSVHEPLAYSMPAVALSTDPGASPTIRALKPEVPMSADSLDVVTFRVFGRAHPERRGWWFKPTGVVRANALGHREELHATMVDSNFHAELTVAGPTSSVIDPMDAKVRLETFVRTRLDAIGLVSGAAVDCEIVQLELPDGETLVLDTSFSGLEIEESKLLFRQLSLVAELVSGVRLGMADFRQAIRSPIDTALFCYRGLDGIRADVALNEELSEAASWERMREITGLDLETDIGPIKDLADLRRHGHDASISSEQRARSLEVLQRALVAYTRWCATEVEPVRRALEKALSEQTGSDGDGSESDVPQDP